MKLGKYFTLEELTHSQVASRYGISNQPNNVQIDALKALVRNILDPLREAVGHPVIISSGFRNEAVNRLVGGSKSSQHRLGEAADIVVPSMSTPAVIQIIRDLKLPFDQVIDEFGSWVHVSYGPRQRRQILKARRDSSGKTVYSDL